MYTIYTKEDISIPKLERLAHGLTKLERKEHKSKLPTKISYKYFIIITYFPFLIMH